MENIRKGDLMREDTFEKYQLFFNDVQFPEVAKMKASEQGIADLISTTYDLVRAERKKHVEENKRRIEASKGNTEGKTVPSNSGQQ